MGFDSDYLGDALVQLAAAKGDSGLLEAGAEAYRSTLKVYTFETSAPEWARSNNLLGDALDQLAMANGAVRVKSLQEAIGARRAALRYFDFDKSPSEWALIQNRLGFALSQLSLTESGSGLNSSEEAVKAHQAALKVFTFEKSPLDWAKTQSLLGYVLGYLGARIEGKKGLPSIQAAIDAHRASLRVYTFEKTPNEWLASQNNLGYALNLLAERQQGEPSLAARTEAEKIYLEILALFPNQATAYNGVLVIYHERAFQFDKAFELTRKWLEQNPNDLSGQLNLAENSFTTERFDDCDRRTSALIDTAGIDANNRVALRAIQIANLLALKNENKVNDLVQAMVSDVTNQAADFRVTWSFAGTTHFVSLNKNLSSHQSWLKNLFAALAQPDRDSILRALTEVKKKFKSSVAVRLPTFTDSSHPLELTHENNLHCFEVNRSHPYLRSPA